MHQPLAYVTQRVRDRTRWRVTPKHVAHEAPGIPVTRHVREISANTPLLSDLLRKKTYRSLQATSTLIFPPFEHERMMFSFLKNFKYKFCI